jgi:hypothetical protein
MVKMTAQNTTPDLCLWSHRPDRGTRPISIARDRTLEAPLLVHVCPEHEERVRQHYRWLAEHQSKFFAAMGLAVVSFLLPLFLDSLLGLGIPLALLGGALVAYPVAAPLTVARNGIAGSMRILRVFGTALVLMGLGFMALAVWGGLLP